MCTCITFCLNGQLTNTTLIGPVAFAERELCEQMYLYYNLPGQTVNGHCFDWSCGIWRTRVVCTWITFCWTRQIFNTALIGPVVFGERELCVLVLHSGGPVSYLTLL
jgi:hypothetical protein